MIIIVTFQTKGVFHCQRVAAVRTTLLYQSLMTWQIQNKIQNLPQTSQVQIKGGEKSISVLLGEISVNYYRCNHSRITLCCPVVQDLTWAQVCVGMTSSQNTDSFIINSANMSHLATHLPLLHWFENYLFTCSQTFGQANRLSVLSNDGCGNRLAL